jgi:hypothetical protein
LARILRRLCTPRYPGGLDDRGRARYDAEPLGQELVALAAALSSDGARILTGHPDGRLRPWDARTLTLIATSD